VDIRCSLTALTGKNTITIIIINEFHRDESLTKTSGPLNYIYIYIWITTTSRSKHPTQLPWLLVLFSTSLSCLACKWCHFEKDSSTSQMTKLQWHLQPSSTAPILWTDVDWHDTHQCDEWRDDWQSITGLVQKPSLPNQLQTKSNCSQGTIRKFANITNYYITLLCLSGQTCTCESFLLDHWKNFGPMLSQCYQ